MTEALQVARGPAHAAASCFQAHRRVVEAAAGLSRRLTGVFVDADLFRMGAGCMRLAAEGALQTQDTTQALRLWRECDLADRQIRMVTYWALRAGRLDAPEYDGMFHLLIKAARLREQERMRLRERLWRLA